MEDTVNVLVDYGPGAGCRYCLRIPDNLQFDSVAPLLCAGITTYSPLMHYEMNKPGFKLGVVGLGGLGHMAVKFGKAMGLEVTVISTSDHKKQEALEVLKADHFLISKNEKEMQVLLLPVLPLLKPLLSQDSSRFFSCCQLAPVRVPRPALDVLFKCATKPLLSINSSRFFTCCQHATVCVFWPALDVLLKCALEQASGKSSASQKNEQH